MSHRRALHFVLKIGDRRRSIIFLKDIMGMQVLRHEEFNEGCAAQCNGPYAGKWSKTMIGYGPEDNHFVLELTYNYGIGSYKLGNDFQCIYVSNPSAFERIISGAWPVLHRSTDTVEVEAPGGYRFIVDNKPSDGGDPVKAIALSCSNLNRSIGYYWSRKCGMNLILSNDKEAVFSYAAEQCNLKLAVIGANVDHASAYGRIAFSCPRDQLLPIQDLMKREGEVVLKDLVSLDTPGKATVEVVILADPDGNEICFVGDEAFRQLSQVDPKADELLMQAIRDDSSDEWYMKHGGKVAE